MEYLLSNRLLPITLEIGFAEATSARAAETFVSWLEVASEPQQFVVTTVRGSLEKLLRSLLPLTDIGQRRYLWMSTRSGWAAFFDNYFRGSAAQRMAHLARLLHARTVRLSAVPAVGGLHYANIVEVYAPEPVDGPLNNQRVVYVANDGGRWRFVEAGDPFPHENRATYGARRIRDRFPVEALDHFARGLGIQAFSEEFFAPDGEALLVTETTPAALARGRTYTLEEARHAAGI